MAPHPPGGAPGLVAGPPSLVKAPAREEPTGGAAPPGSAAELRRRSRVHAGGTRDLEEEQEVHAGGAKDIGEEQVHVGQAVLSGPTMQREGGAVQWEGARQLDGAEQLEGTKNWGVT